MNDTDEYGHDIVYRLPCDITGERLGEIHNIAIRQLGAQDRWNGGTLRDEGSPRIELYGNHFTEKKIKNKK